MQYICIIYIRKKFLSSKRTRAHIWGISPSIKIFVRNRGAREIARESMRPIDWWSQYKKSMQVWKEDRRMNQLIKESISDSLTPKLTSEADQSQVQNQIAINTRCRGWINNAFCHNFLSWTWVITGNKWALPKSLEDIQGWNLGSIETCVDRSIWWRTDGPLMWQAFTSKDCRIWFPVHLRRRQSTE